MSEHMTLAFIVSHQALIAAEIARLEGMKATNAFCEIRNEGPLYIDHDFQHVQDELRRLANSVREVVR